MEASLVRLVGNQLQRNVAQLSRGSSTSGFLSWKNQNNNGRGGRDRSKVGCMSFSASSNFRQQAVSENVLKMEKDVEIVKGVAITDHIFEHLGKWPTATAMECSLSGRKYTHEEIYKYSRNFAAALLQMGLQKGNVLAIALPNMPEYSIVTFGAWFARQTITLVNPTYTPYEIGKQLADCEAKTIVTLGLFLPLILEAKSTSPILASMKIIVIGEPQEGCHTFGEMLRVDSSSARLASSTDPDLNTEEDVIVLPYSSGTTGPPKGCMITHYNMVNNLIQSAERISVTPFTNGNPQEVGMGLLPFFHIMAFQALGLYAYRIGGKVLTLPRFEPETFTDCMKNNKLTIIHLVAPLFQFIVNNPELTKEEFANMHGIYNGACPTSRVLIDGVLEKAGKFILIQEGYGMTETSPLTHMILGTSKNEKIGSVGPPVPSTLVKVVGPDSEKALGVGKKGEIWIKGPQVMKGYFRNEEATKATITNDGWLKTGDIGYYDEDKNFYVVDRLKELIKVKGSQVSPSELEATLRTHPAVADVAVVGVPHKEFGEAPRAFVVKKSEAVTEKEIGDFLKGKLSTHKQLAGGVQFVEAIPKLLSGKILRRELSALYLEGQREAEKSK